MSASRPAAGDLRHRLTIEQAVDIADGFGGRDRVWQAVATAWAAISDTSGTAGTVAGAEASGATHAVTLRHRGDLRPGMRFSGDGRVFRILSVVDRDGRKAWLTCQVVEENR